MMLSDIFKIIIFHLCAADVGCLEFVLENLKTFVPVFENITLKAACGNVSLDYNLCKKLTRTTQSLTQCTLECFTRQDCRGFNVRGDYETNFTCELFAGSCDVITLLRALNGCFYYHDKITPPHEVWEQRMDVSSEGWTEVLMQLQDTTVGQDIQNPFNKSWNEYKYGFNLSIGCYWLGNEVIHEMTKSGGCSLFINLYTQNKQFMNVSYDHFRIGSEAEEYNLVSLKFSPSNTFSDGMSGRTGANFSTFDRDHDYDLNQNCASIYGSGWWYGLSGFPKCGLTNLNSFGNYFVYFSGKLNKLSSSEMRLNCT